MTNMTLMPPLKNALPQFYFTAMLIESDDGMNLIHDTNTDVTITHMKHKKTL